MQNFLAILVGTLLLLALRIQGFSSQLPTSTTTRAPCSIGGSRCVSLQVQTEKNEGFNIPEMKEDALETEEEEGDFGEEEIEDDDDEAETEEDGTDIEAETEEDSPAEVDAVASDVVEQVEEQSTGNAVDELNEFESDVDDEQAQLDEEFMGMAIEMALSG